MLSDTLILIGPRVVGAVFLLAALMKVAAPMAFYQHIGQLEIVSRKTQRWLTPVAIGAEAGWGMALILVMWTEILFPVTAIALALLTGLTWWSIKSGKTEDCGCYGGFITPSIGQTIALNGFYIFLIVAAWATVPHPASPQLWAILAVVVSAVAAGWTAEYALRSEGKTGTPLFTPSPLVLGARWKKKWAGTGSADTTTAHIITYLGPSCPYCKRWVRILNAIHDSPNLPPVLGVFGSTKEEIAAFMAETGARFPVATVPQKVMQRLASAVPTTVLVENSKIVDMWGGQMSDEFVGRFKAAFFPDAAQRVPTAGTNQIKRTNDSVPDQAVGPLA